MRAVTRNIFQPSFSVMIKGARFRHHFWQHRIPQFYLLELLACKFKQWLKKNSHELMRRRILALEKWDWRRTQRDSRHHFNRRVAAVKLQWPEPLWEIAVFGEATKLQGVLSPFIRLQIREGNRIQNCQ